MRRFQLRLPRRQLHLHGRKDQRRSQLRYVLHRHSLRNVQTEERRITYFSKNTPQGVFFVLISENLRFSIIFHAFLCSKEKRGKRSEKSLQDLSGFVTSAMSQNFLRLPEFDFCHGKNYSEPRRIFTVCRFFALCKMACTNSKSPSRL